MFTLYLVVPCYNEEAVLPETAKRLLDILRELTAAGRISEQSRILFVNDGSGDRTWELISTLHRHDKRFAGLSLSRNRGHQNALLAGLMLAKDHADAAISLDADLQDDVGAIDRFVSKYEEGCEVVYGVRSSRETDTGFKRNTARGFYKLMSALGVEIVYDHADYRLLSRRALEALSQYGERNLFLRGIAPQLGFKTDTVEYERQVRFAGESKYPLKKMIAFAYLRPHPLDLRHDRHRLDQPSLLHLGPGRPAAADAGGRGGIRGQDLSGNQAAPPVYHLGNAAGSGGGSISGRHMAVQGGSFRFPPF